jgi:predicted DNA-binding transcriptional regulator AlpA
MNNLNPHNLVRNEQTKAGADLTPIGKTDDASQRTGLVACLLLVSSDAEALVALLQQVAASSQIPILFPPFSSSSSHATVAEDRWLKHGEASKNLGISKSTLYRYVSQQRIECRKVAGRLEYRQSSIEKLRREQLRPARFSHDAGSIIPSAFSSGK